MDPDLEIIIIIEEIIVNKNKKKIKIGILIMIITMMIPNKKTIGLINHIRENLLQKKAKNIDRSMMEMMNDLKKKNLKMRKIKSIIMNI